MFRKPHSLLILFLALTLIPAGTLGWLGWRLVEQGRLVEERHIQEHRERAADLIVAALQQKLSADEQRLADASASRNLASYDAHVIEIADGILKILPSTPLLYYPVPSALPEAPGSPFQTGEDDEFRLRDFDGAIVQFRDLVRSSNPAVRAGANLRLARNLRKAGQPAAALDVYAELARQDDVALAGAPASLVAQRARCVLLAEVKRADFKQQCSALNADLHRGRWQLDRTQYLYFSGEALRELKAETESETESGSEALSAAVDDLWTKFKSARTLQTTAAGREEFVLHGASGAIVWHAAPDRLVALVAGPQYVEHRWLTALQPLLREQDVNISLGTTVALDAGLQTQRAASDTGLPWTLQIRDSNPRIYLAQAQARRTLLLLGLAALLLVVCGGSYFVARAVSRELALARLQSDFVAAVSHEFRTPLTLLSQVTEILIDNRVPDPDRLQQYYATQARATGRLKRLVESLLDFGRMEAGTKPYRMERLDAATLVHAIVDEFRLEASADGHKIEILIDPAPGDAPAINGDVEALTHALRNLLDNAVKYSPECKTIWVEMARQIDGIAISVRDHGFGIPPSEQKEIFQKFVRGAASRIHGIKGTGVGLAMVKHIVNAHGGAIRLESNAGQGSTFTILLPEIHAANSHC